MVMIVLKCEYMAVAVFLKSLIYRHHSKSGVPSLFMLFKACNHVPARIWGFIVFSSVCGTQASD